MPDRAKPPCGYDTWLDWCLSDEVIVPLSDNVKRWCRAELEELRNELALFKATAEDKTNVETWAST